MNNQCPFLICPLHVQKRTLIIRMNPIRLFSNYDISLSLKIKLFVIVVINVCNSMRIQYKYVQMLVGFQKYPLKNISVNLLVFLSQILKVIWEEVIFHTYLLSELNIKYNFQYCFPFNSFTGNIFCHCAKQFFNQITQL